MLKKIITTVPMLFIFIFLSCSNNNSSDNTASASWTPDDSVLPLSVEVLEVSNGKLIPFIEASGLIYGQNEAWAVSETQGKITEISVQLGQRVKKGDILIKVENSLPRLNRDLALQQFESARHDYNAVEKSYNNGGSSKSNLNTARTRLLQTQAAYESATQVFDNTEIKAPFDGSIALIDNSLTVGTVLSPGIRIARVVDTSYMKMEIAVGERQIGILRKGIDANVIIPSGDNSHVVRASVSAIGSGSDPATGSYPVLITWKNEENREMRSGFSAKVEIATTGNNNKIIIPSSAIVIRNRIESVILAIDGKAVVRKIIRGETLGGHTVITDGLNIGDILIVSALSSLGEDYPVETSLIGKTGEWR